jgi:hypothetical protein
MLDFTSGEVQPASKFPDAHGCTCLVFLIIWFNGATIANPVSSNLKLSVLPRAVGNALPAVWRVRSRLLPDDQPYPFFGDAVRKVEHIQYHEGRWKPPLWEGRHRSSLVQSGRYLLTCLRYIELNPVRAGMVARPEEYCWSSYAVNAWGDQSWLTPHCEYPGLAWPLITASP